MNEQRQDQIDRYVRGEMTTEESRRFEEALAKDADLRADYDFTKQVQETLKNRKMKLDLMKQWDQEEKDEETVSMTARHRHRVAFRLAGGIFLVAALVTGVFFIILPQKETSRQDVPQLDLTLYENYRSGSSVPQIASLISQKRYEEALLRIEDEEKDLIVQKQIRPISEEEREQMEYERAAARLDADHLKWLKVYVLMGLDRKDEALKLLNDMRYTSGPYQLKADSLYRLLK